MNFFDIYAGVYDRWMKTFHFYKPETIIKHLKPKKNDIILDIGGGTGYLANKISDRCKKVIVLDSSSKMLEQTKKYKKRNLTVRKADALSIPYKNNYFDAVLFIDSLHHIKKIDAALKEARRVLKKNGRIIILEFTRETFLGKYVQFLDWLFIEKVRFLNPEELREKCLKAGFKGKTKRISKKEYLFIGKK